MLTLPTYPILGRDDELKLYNKLLTHFLMHSKNDGNKKEACIKMLVLEGEAKSGKTRLGEEFLYTTPTDIPIQIILAENEVHEPYNVLRQMYFSAMGIAKKAPRHTKQETLQFFLTDYHGEDLCALNEVFDSRFPMTENFQNFSGETKVHAIATLLQYLASVVCFFTFTYNVKKSEIIFIINKSVVFFHLRIHSPKP
ncbi:hypothetical protein HHI36_002379 [Cryptolaemus montrouzieri]|uniref:Uncharacterized protein n=1 Tax=Cryptolaemus montrouzieri TaxID=559131 RepID=A0ABD2PAH7_9CUCU